MTTNNSVKNIFDLMATYEITNVWKVNEELTRYFTEEDIQNVVSAYVVEGDWGNSVKIKRVLPDGTQKVSFQPLSRESSFILGDKVDLLQCKLICLQKEGHDDIWRLEEI